jgi:hypothetical protein
MFLIQKIMFHILFSYEVSKYLRLYSFNAYVFFIIIDGNVDYFSYWFGSDCKKLIHFNI